MIGNEAHHSSQQSQNNYVFLIRRIVDLDHFLPLTTALLGVGVLPSMIKFVVVTRHRSLSRIANDVRFDLVSKKGIKICMDFFEDDSRHSWSRNIYQFLPTDFLVWCALSPFLWILGRRYSTYPSQCFFLESRGILAICQSHLWYRSPGFFNGSHGYL